MGSRGFWAAGFSPATSSWGAALKRALAVLTGSGYARGSVGRVPLGSVHQVLEGHLLVVRLRLQALVADFQVHALHLVQGHWELV
jgi:hypothetical protein